MAGFKLELVGADGTVLRRVEEFGNADRTLGQFAIPSGGFAVKISATSQFAGIGNSSYICRFVATP